MSAKQHAAMPVARRGGPGSRRPGRGLAAIAALAGTMASGPPHAAGAEQYPSRPIRMVVPFTPGTLDVLARAIGQRLNDKYGQPIVVDSRPGAATIVGSEIVSRARPDGYTLLMITTTFVINPSLYRKLPYDPQRDFTPITQLDAIYNILLVSAGAPWTGVPELIAAAKAKPAGLTHASAGVGTAPHIATELYKMTAGIDMTHVPYKGIPEAAADVMTGRVSMLMATTASAAPWLASGKLKALAVTSAKRLPALPHIPALAETLPGFEADAFRGIVGPGGMPKDLARRISADIGAAITAPAVAERLTLDGGTVVASTPEAFAAFLRAQAEKWGKVIRGANLRAD